MPEDLKTCFVIAPIGEEDSDIRDRSDQILNFIIRPALREAGGFAEPVRADKITEPGIITSQIIDHVVEDDLVIADLSGRNPNVFYELALRHALKKPVIHMISHGETLPFDVLMNRTIHVSISSPKTADGAKECLLNTIRSCGTDATFDNPISAALELKALRVSDNLQERSNAEILESLAEIRNLINTSIKAPISLYDPKQESLLKQTFLSTLLSIQSLQTFPNLDAQILEVVNEVESMVRFMQEEIFPERHRISERIRGLAAHIQSIYPVKKKPSASPDSASNNQS